MDKTLAVRMPATADDNQAQTPPQAAAQVPASKPTPQQPEEKKGFTNQEIQVIEADRQDPKSWNVIHLLRDGNYWHANEWSAWLMGVIVPDEMKRRHPQEERIVIAPVKKFAKNLGGEYIFVGCQEKSFDKYLPKELQMSWTPVDALRIDVAVELPAELAEKEPLSYERLLKMYMDWKEQVPLSKDKADKKPQSQQAAAAIAGLPFMTTAESQQKIMSLISQVMSYPIAARTPFQAQQFLFDIQQQLLAHF